jgi:hypothetical protein
MPRASSTPSPRSPPSPRRTASSAHVDGCVGGFHFAIMRRMGTYTGPAYDFSVPGVTSISTDLHKYGYAPKGASVIMYRSKDLRRHQVFACARTTTYALINATIMSTKSGGPVAAAWATLNHIGEDGYRKIITGVMETTRQMKAGVAAIPGLKLLGDAQMCMFSFTSDEFNIFHIADAMKPRGWYVQPPVLHRALPPFVRCRWIRIRNGNTDEILDTDLYVGPEFHGSGWEGNQIPLNPPFSKGETGWENSVKWIHLWRCGFGGADRKVSRRGAGVSSPWGVALWWAGRVFLPLGLGGGGLRGTGPRDLGRRGRHTRPRALGWV